MPGRLCPNGADEHLETFLAEARLRGGGEGLPRFVERELREFVTCGSMARGFARFRCAGCKRELLVAFSCKGRGFCRSCCGRRMGALAAHLVDGVLGGLPVRQWVLTLPHRLRYALAYDHRLCRAVLGVFVRAVLAFERRRAESQGIRGRAGAVTAIQRCGSALNNVHFHTLVAEGVFEEEPGGLQRFVGAQPPTGSRWRVCWHRCGGASSASCTATASRWRGRSRTGKSATRWRSTLGCWPRSRVPLFSAASPPDPAPAIG